jgi:uncharacterized protein
MQFMKETILITGGSGLVGKVLTSLLTAQGYAVSILSRSPRKATENVTYYTWDLDKNEIDTNCFLKATHIIHLAGENVASGRWTTQKKELILKSRTRSTALLYQALSKSPHQVKAFVSASATGFYGSQTSDTLFSEDHPSGADFLAHVCRDWEDSVDRIASLGIRTVKLRTGVVLANKGSALQKMLPPFQMGLGSAIGTGKQYLPWIHISDLCNMYLMALNKPKMHGSFNAVVGDDTTNAQLSKAIAQQLNKPFFMPNVPAFLLWLVFGKMAVILTNGSRVSAQKIKEAGFVFEFESLEEALRDLLKK